MPWVKGQSGNPRGRQPGMSPIQVLARTHGPDAIATLAEICKSGETENARVTAAIALLDRGYGKPAQHTTVNAFRTVIEMTDAELLAIVAEAESVVSGLLPPPDSTQLN